ncbi:hypothetical protein [Streptomyces sp. DH24]|uniref:hypothetical protein n=1 Tax=Streptomyces sp. DH24 TaxID=3040123 RepID=UPI0024428BCD|nr:hypothetical protein [Streptomyces sp. DH24]MDG9717774.1 hypothetical protein [Streptomyces sp. DH24]
MPERTRVGTLTACAAVALTAATALVVSAPAGAVPAASAPRAQAAPAFLSAADLPPHPSSAWTAGEITDGVPVELLLCLERALPEHGSRYRDFRTELDTGARQLTVVTGSTAGAKSLAARLNEEIRSCPERVEADPEVAAELADHGHVAVEEGAHVYGLHTRTAWGASDIRLLSVGRDGRTVTVVDWSQLGDFDDAPVAAFRATTTAAVAKLY